MVLSSRQFHRLLVGVLLMALFVGAFQPGPVEGQTEDILKNLRPGHPRLFVLKEDLANLPKTIENDPLLKQWYERLQKEAKRMLTESPVEHKLVGPRLLSQSRTALRRISTLAALYRLDGDSAKAERARKEMLTAAAFKDWNPSHFLDTAEMANALGIGYDWLYDFLTPADRTTIRQAIVAKALKPGLDVYRNNRWWSKSHHNWNQVCNGGLTVGALAIADEEPALAGEIIAHGRKSIPLAMKSFAPDGGWAEGPGYWNYATIYNVYYLAAVQTALGTDFGLKDMPGFPVTGEFRIHSVGPLNKTFNYADAGDGAGTAPQMLWLAQTFQRPIFAQHERQLAAHHPGIFDLLWSAQKPAGKKETDLPRDAAFRGIDVAFFRSSWNDPQAVFVGFHGGDNKANHSHLDIGSFVLDALGVRWALDLGGDNYNLPGYFGKQRWTYYRLRTESHNTLTIDGANQNPSARAPLLAFLSTPEKAHAVADLTAAYAPKLKQARRGMALLERRRVLVQDEVEAAEPVNLIWNFHTRAAIEVNGSQATLTQGKAKLEVRILEPKEARFEILPCNPPPPQAQQPDVHNLAIRFPEKIRQTRLAVLLTPQGNTGPVPKIEPLEDWIAKGKLR